MAGVALAKLIEVTKDRNSWTDREVVRRAAEAGLKLNPQEMTNYKREGMKTIVPRKIKALAEGLDLPAYRVAQAVLEDHGIVVPLDVRTVEDAIRYDADLPAHTRQALLAVLASVSRP